MKISPKFLGILAIAGAIALATPAIASSFPNTPARFETSLATPIASTDSAMTLVSGTLNDGTTLSGYTCFTIDVNQPNVEDVCGTASGTSVTGLARGIGGSTGTTTVAALKFAHRRGADVQITSFPTITILARIGQAIDGWGIPIKYDSSVATSTIAQNGMNLVDVNLLNDTAFAGAGVINATTLAKGVIQLATQAQIAASTGTGSSGATLVVPASAATSTWNSATAPNVVVVTKNTGKIDDNFIATSTLFATTSIATGPIGNVGKNFQIITSTGTSTFSVPAGVTKVIAEVVGAGGAGGGGTASNAGANGGGGGGYCLKAVDTSATTTIQVFVGTGGTASSGTAGTSGAWSTFGTNGFYCSATGGTGGGVQSGVIGQGGTGTGGDLNITGQGGGTGSNAATSNGFGGFGGSSHYGGGAAATQINTGNGSPGGNYGGGGGGGHSTSGATIGGVGAQGAVILHW